MQSTLKCGLWLLERFVAMGFLCGSKHNLDLFCFSVGNGIQFHCVVSKAKLVASVGFLTMELYHYPIVVILRTSVGMGIFSVEIRRAIGTMMHSVGSLMVVNLNTVVD